MTKQELKIIESIKKMMEQKFRNESTGHDWWHILRVYKMSCTLSDKTSQSHNRFTIEISALLHDVADWKFHEGDESAGPKQAEIILAQLGVDRKIIERVKTIIKEISFKGAGVETKMSSLEGMIVQDADRLDALGAIGIARTFAYGGKNDKPLHDPSIKPILHTDFESYKKKQTTPINHFYEKLLLLKDLLNTNEAKNFAKKRHRYMENFLKQFFLEWEGQL
jgi:uncharacterized protein